MAIYQKDDHEQRFNKYIAEVLSIYAQETHQEDYTITLRHKADMTGYRYKMFRNRNWRMLDALEKLKVMYRHSQSRWR